MGNGDFASGDGWRYKGKGFIQLTGKNNYVAFGAAISEDLTKNTDLLITPKYASLSACWFFSKNGLNTIADKGATDDVVKEITKKINGGLNGISERTKNFHEIFSLYQVSASVASKIKPTV
jgi:putative chitinase